MNDFLELTQGLIEKNDFEETEFQPLPAGDYTSRKIYNNFHLTVKTAEASIKRIYKMAEFAGITPTTFSDVDSIVTFCEQLLDKCFEITYDEEAFNKVKVNRGL